MSKVLMSFGDWDIIEYDYHPPPLFHASHMCRPTSKCEFAWFIDDDEPRCHKCRAPVPDGVYTLITLLRTGG